MPIKSFFALINNNHGANHAVKGMPQAVRSTLDSMVAHDKK